MIFIICCVFKYLISFEFIQNRRMDANKLTINMDKMEIVFPRQPFSNKFGDYKTLFTKINTKN